MVKIKHFIVFSFALLTDKYKYKNLPEHLSWEAIQRLAASGSYSVVSDLSIPDDSEPSFRKHSTVVPL